MRHMGVISFMTSTVSLKNGSVMGQRLNHCTFLRLVWLSGQGSYPVCDSSGSPAVNGSPIPRRFAKCSGTGLHRNPIDVSPGGGNSMLEAGPETLFFIANLSTAILFSTPSLSRQRVGSDKEWLGNCACYKTISNHIDYHIISKKTRRLTKTQKNIIKIFITQRHRIQPLRFSRRIFLAYMWTYTTAYMTWETVHKSRRSKWHACTIRGHISLIILFLIILPSP